MKWSWKIGTFSGIAVYIHATFLLLVGWYFLMHAGRGIGSGLMGVAFILLAFLCIVLHEFGHALAARRYGVQTRDITLYPIGGVARLERIPRDPGQELVIALAGPAVNVVIAGGLLLGMLIGNAPSGFQYLSLTPGNLITNLMWTNVMLVLFNLLPAFPMDGGRALRAFLAQRMEYGRATQTAANIGQAMALLFGFAGLLGQNYVLVFVAFFVFMGAAQEAATVQAELAFRDVPARRAMMTRFATLAPEDRLANAVEQLLAGAQHDFPVMRDGAVVGLLTRGRLIEGLSRSGADAVVGEVMEPAPPTAMPGESLEDVFQRMRGNEVQTVPVVAEGRLVGLITLENVGEFLMVKAATEQNGDPASVASVIDGGQGADEIREARSTWTPSERARS